MINPGEPMEGPSPTDSTGPLSVRTGEAPQPSPLPAPADAPSDPFAGLPLWQHRYIAALQAGASNDEAAASANATPQSIATAWLDPLGARYDPRFARAVDMVTAGVALLGREHVRSLALAQAPGLVGHFAQQARDKAVRPRDQQGAGRIVLEVAQLTGQGAGTTVQQTTVVQVDAAPAAGSPLRRPRIIDSKPSDKPPER